MMKFDPYLSMDPVPGEAPTFNLVISSDEMSVDFYELTEAELREFLKDIEDQIELHLSVNTKLQSLTSKAKTQC